MNITNDRLNKKSADFTQLELLVIVKKQDANY